MHRSTVFTAKPVESPQEVKVVSFEGQSASESKETYRSLPSFETATADQKRVLNALRKIERPYEIKSTELDEKTLTTLAKSTNSASFHFSGNCTLLACLVLYNIEIGRAELSAGNIYPIYEPSSNDVTAKIFFGDAFTSVRTTKSTTKELTVQLLKCFKETNKRFFLIGLDYYKIFGKDMGHAFNGIILGEGDSVRVVYVDAWKSNKVIYSPAELEKRYTGGVNFEIGYVGSPVVALKMGKGMKR